MVINDLQLSNQVEEIKTVKVAVALLEEGLIPLDDIPWHKYVCGEDASVPITLRYEYEIALGRMFQAAVSLEKRSISGSQVFVKW